MRLELKTSDGQGGFIYKPLDLFEDFEVKYNHQYENYDEIGGKQIPYTAKFKIPLTENNRALCGVPFDATYPLAQKVDGRAVDNANNVVFSFVTDINGQTINVLEPYITISIIDLISKGISDLNNLYMSDLLDGLDWIFGSHFWMFGDQLQLDEFEPEKFWLFSYLNFNNKEALFSHDPYRGISQLQPTFVLGMLIDKIFTKVGIDVNSNFLNNDDELFEGIKANELGLTIPVQLKTDAVYPTTHNAYFAGTQTIASSVITDRSVGVPSQQITSSRIRFNNPFDTFGAHVPFNYDWESDIRHEGVESPDPLGGRWCCKTTDTINIKFRKNAVSILPRALLGKLTSTQYSAFNSWMYATGVVGTPPDLAVKVVNADMTRPDSTIQYFNLWYGSNFYEYSDSYDSTKATRIGTARYIGILNGFLQYEIDFFDEIDVEFDVEANQDIELGLILAPIDEDTVSTIRYNATNFLYGGNYVWDINIQDGFVEYENVSTDAHLDGAYDQIHTIWTREGGANQYPFSMEISVNSPANLPSGNDGWSPSGGYTQDLLNYCNINMAETMKSIKDYTLLEIVKMIMSRFNLELYTKANGTMWIDTAENRASGTNLIIDHLIDETIDVDFTYSEEGKITITDSNPSFYAEDYNKLDKYEISADKRGEVALTFNSAIYNGKMYRDEYDGSGYDLLKWFNSTNFWGTADRQQVVPKDLKPMFCFIKGGVSRQVYFPLNMCTYARPLTSQYHPDEEFNIGFYNQFRIDLQMQSEAVNVHPTTGFKLYSFEDKEIIAGGGTLYNQRFYSYIRNRIDNEAVNIEVDLYVDENTFSTLLDFPTVIWKGQEWIFKGLNDFPLTAQNGGVCSISLVKKKDWILADTIPPSIPQNLVSWWSAGSSALRSTWDAVVDFESGLKHYEFWRNENGGAWTKLFDTILLEHFDLSTSAGITYGVKVRAVDNQDNMSDFSNITYTIY